ncbi:hypothetical protein SAMN04487972_1534 [Paracoccus halophilus]|uniref:Uncharacterized protein n=1 Tax=Paracoccus halophilus TaxID=376733 RepID=A0A099EU34_9RHOB|nr:hypothetical protein [Paracoccus halophilus]KGJ01789.1 hypothetical protein IT41_19275 [Paracoccus halophilus]SFA62628.1 hypothetical protein SAMN04487972_1534 [Paracoccus halophilus]
MRQIAALALAWFALALPGHGWELVKMENIVTTSQGDGRYLLSLSCQRGDNHLNFDLFDQSLTGDELQGVEAVMMWIRAPDGRTDKWSVKTYREGPNLTGRVAFSAQTLDFFRDAESLEVEDIFGRRVLFRSDMKGTGAARIAFSERCGI